MPRRLLRVIALLFAVALLGTACGSDDDGGDASGTSEAADEGAGAEGEGEAASFETVEEGKLTVCSDIPYAPFEYEDGGDLKGIDIDLMSAMAARLDLEPEFRDTDFDGIFASLAAGNCDVIASSVSITDERKENNDFTDPYFEINQSLLVRKGEEGNIKDLGDMDGKTIGVQSETTGASYAEENADANGYQVKEFTGADELFTALKANQVDGVLQDFPINSYNAETTGDTAIAVVFEEDEKEQYGFVVKKGNDELVDALNEALSALRESGEYDDILSEYLGESASS